MIRKWVRLLLLLTYIITCIVVFPIQSSGTYTQENTFLPRTLITLSNQFPTMTKQFHFHWAPDQLQWNLEENGMRPNLEGYSLLNHPYQPMLPYRVWTHPIPDNHEIVYIKTAQIHYEKLPFSSYPVKLADDPLVFRNDELNKPIGKKPNQLSPLCFPDNNFEYTQWSDQKQQTVRLSLFPVYIVKNEWFLVTDLSIEIGYSPSQDEASTPLATNTHSVIVCPDELASSAEGLKKLQESDGYKVRIVTLSEAKKYPRAEVPSMDGILGCEDYPDNMKSSIMRYDIDTAFRIRSMLRAFLKEGTINYLTILGDALYIPPSYYVSSEDESGEYEQWLPTDYFYSAPDAKGSQFRFDIHVGRLPARNPEEAQLMVDKLRRYRKALQPGWFKNVALMGGDPFNRDYFGELVTNDAVNRDFFNGMTIRRYFKTEGLYNTEGVLDGFREGKFGFLWALGHGTGDGLALEPGRVDSKDILDLPKNDYLPIVVTESCDNGAFDSRIVRPNYSTNPHFSQPTSFSEAIMSSNGGGIAYIGGVRSNFGGWIQEYQKGVLHISYVYYTDAMITHFFEQYSKGPSTLGALVSSAMAQYIEEDWFQYFTHTKTFFGFTFQGDPTLTIPFLGTNKKTLQAPELSYEESMPLTYDDIPLFSMNDGIHVKAKHPSTRLTYIISDYLDHQTPLLQKGEIKGAGTAGMSHFFVPERKTTMTIRIQSEDGKETRIVFYSRYNVDLVVHQENDFTILHQNEAKEYSFTLANEGIYKADNINVTIQTPGSVLKEQVIPFIPILSSQRIYYNYTPKNPGEEAITLSATSLPNETETNDNSHSTVIRTVSEPIARVGIMHASTLNDQAYYEKRFMVRQLNQHFREQNQAVEVFVVPLGTDENQVTSLERLNLDMIVLYSPYCFDGSSEELLFYLEEFEQKGGAVLGLFNLGYNHLGVMMTELQEYFGIQKQNFLYMQYLADNTIELRIVDEGTSLFSQSKYTMNSRYFISTGEPWETIKLGSASLIGVSDDNRVALTQFGSRYFYSGYFTEQDLIDRPDAFLFLTELLMIPLQKRFDVAIESVSVDPVMGNSKQETNMIVQCKNVGNTDADNLNVLINQKVIGQLPLLAPGESASMTYGLSPWIALGVNELTVEITSLKKEEEENTTNNVYSFSYYAKKPFNSEEVFLTIEGPLERTVNADTTILTGKTKSGGKLRVNDSPVAVNSDGSFSVLLPLQEGMQTFVLEAEYGQKSEMVKVRINRQKSQLIQLCIHDPVPFFNHEPGEPMEAAPFIYESLTYVPLRIIAQTFGAEIKWDSVNRKISLYYQNLVIHMIVGERKATIEDPSGSHVVPLQGPSIIINGRTFVPIRFIAETFGAKVDWDANLEMVSIQRMMDLPETEPKNMEFLSKESITEAFSSTILHGDNEGVLFYPTCMDRMEDGSLLISYYDGLYRWDVDSPPERLFRFQDWQSTILKDFAFKKSNSLPNKALFRCWKDKILVYDGGNLYVVDPNTPTLLHKIGREHYATYPYPKQNYTEIAGIEIEGDLAYVLSLWEGISVIDLLNGKVISYYPMPHYPVSFSQYNHTLTIAGFFGEILQFNTIQGEMITFKPSTDLYPESIFQDGETYYLQSLYPKGIYEIKLANQRYSLGTAMQLSTRGSYSLEMLLFHSKGRFGLITDSLTKESCITKLSRDFSVGKNLFQEAREWLDEHPSFCIHVGQTWITKNQQVIVTQENPQDATTLQLFDFKGNWITDISVDMDPYQSSLLGYQYRDPSVVGALIANTDEYGQIQTYVLQLIDFQNPEKIKYDTIELKIDPLLVTPGEWTFDDQNFCIRDTASFQYVVYSLKNGREIKHYKGFSQKKQPVYLSGKRLIAYIEKNLYVFDSYHQLMRVYNAKGELQAQWDLQWSTPKEALISDMVVLSPNEFALLDASKGQVLKVKEGAITQVWGNNKGPYSMDIRDDLLLVNDTSTFQVTLSSIDENQNKKPTLSVYPKEFNAKITYPKAWSAVQVIYRWDDDTNIRIEHPKELQYEFVYQSDQIDIIQWKWLEPGSSNTEIKGAILIRTEQNELQIPVHLLSEPYKTVIYPSLIKKGDAILYPKVPNLIKEGVFYMEFSTIGDVFSFTCTQMKNDLMIAMQEDTLVIKTGEGKAYLMSQGRKQDFDLGAPIQMHKGKFLIPMNAILKHLNIKTLTESFPISF